MTQWATFAGLTGVVTVLLLVLSHLTKTALTDPEPGAGNDDSSRDDSQSQLTGDPPVSTDRDAVGDPFQRPDEPAESEAVRSDARDARNAFDGGRGYDGPESMSPGTLLANVALSQGLFAAVLVGAAVYAGIPPDALGIAFSSEYVVSAVGLGTAFGLALYAANEVGSLSAKRLGIDHSEDLREMLDPKTAGGWFVLLAVVLPLIAVFEEFLFRAALIGALSVGFGLSPWPLVVISSLAFALGHGMQGPTGVAVTGLLGLVLGAAFVLSGSLLLVVVAHYLINALEFAVHEGLGVEWGATEN